MGRAKGVFGGTTRTGRRGRRRRRGLKQEKFNTSKKRHIEGHEDIPQGCREWFGPYENQNHVQEDEPAGLKDRRRRRREHDEVETYARTRTRYDYAGKLHKPNPPGFPYTGAYARGTQSMAAIQVKNEDTIELNENTDFGIFPGRI